MFSSPSFSPPSSPLSSLSYFPYLRLHIPPRFSIFLLLKLSPLPSLPPLSLPPLPFLSRFYFLLLSSFPLLPFLFYSFSLPFALPICTPSVISPLFYSIPSFPTMSHIQQLHPILLYSSKNLFLYSPPLQYSRKLFYTHLSSHPSPL